MEAVSAVKMRKAQEQALTARPYAVAAFGILERLSASMEGLSHPLSKEREVKSLCTVVITSDKGLAGSLNSAVIKAALQAITASGLLKESVGIIAVGRKAHDFFSKRGFVILESYRNVSDAVSLDDMRAITEKLIELYKGGVYDECLIAYTNFISTFRQEAVVRRVLPLSIESIRNMVSGITPEKGKFAEVALDEPITVPTYTIEPSPEAVLTALIPSLINIEQYHALLEAKASEHSARMVAMKNASDKARDLSKELTLVFNKARQAAITREVSEITGGIEAMAR